MHKPSKTKPRTKIVNIGPPKYYENLEEMNEYYVEYISQMVNSMDRQQRDYFRTLVESPSKDPTNGSSQTDEINRLRYELAQYRNRTTCIKCMEKHRSHVFTACRHLVMCHKCITEASCCPVCECDGPVAAIYT